MTTNQNKTLPEVVVRGAGNYGYKIEFDASLEINRLYRQNDNNGLVGVEVKKNRLRVFMPATKNLLFSGPVTEQAIGAFLESFYFAKIKTATTVELA